MKKPQLKSRLQRILIIVIPCVLLGLMLLVAGIGKIPGFSDLGTFPGRPNSSRPFRLSLAHRSFFHQRYSPLD